MPRHALLTALICLCVSAGCSTFARDDDTPPNSPYELAIDPRIAFDPQVAVEDIRLRGIRLGDDEAMIPSAKIKASNELGWIETRQMCKYRIIDGRVVTMGIWDYGVLDRLGVSDESEIETILGKPDRRYELSTNIVSYHYRGGLVRTLWHRFENRLVALNVGRAMSEPLEQTP